MLNEQRRTQLDGIVSQMVANQESDDNVQFVVNDFKAKYANETPEQAFVEKQKFPVPEKVLTPEERTTNFNNATAQAEKYAKESKKANSLFGKIKNTVKGVGDVLAASQIGLGESIAKAGGKKNLDVYVKNVTDLSNTQVKLLQQIKEKEARGEDANNLKRIYNDNIGQIEENKKAITDYGGSLPSSAEIAGQGAGVLLDIVTAGSYGTAAKGAKTGKLFAKTAPVVEKASTIVPEVKKMAEVVSKPSGILTKKGATNILKGGATGYAYDVSEGLQGRRGEDREGAKAFIPGLGTAVGLGLPAVTETIQSAKNQFNSSARFARITEKRTKDLSKLEQNKVIEKVVSKAKKKGFDVKEFVANSDLLHKSVDKTGTISTKGEGQAVAQMQEFLKPHEDVVNKLIKKEGGFVTVKELQSKMFKSIDDAGLQGSSLIKAREEALRDIEGYMLRADPNGNIPLDIIHKAKTDKYSNINFFTEAEKQRSAKAIARALKETVEEKVSSADIKKLNNELSEYYTVIDYLEKLHGRKVEGGRLGKHFARTIGAIVGSHFGPLGAIGGVEVADKIKGEQFRSTFGGRTGRLLKTSEALQKATDDANRPVKSYSSSRKSTGALNMSQSTTNTKVTKPAIDISPIVPNNKTLVKRDSSLTGKDAEIQEKSIAKYESNPDKMVDDYIKENGKMVNTDEARKLFKDVGYEGTNSAAVQEASSAVAKQAYVKLLKQSEGPDVIITAGGSGTGKTSVIKNLFPEEIADAGVILDGNLSKMSSAKDRIQEAIDAGKTPNIIYVYRDITDSWINGVVKRMKGNKEEGGRIVPLSVFIENHKGSYDVIKRLMDDPENGKSFNVTLADNSLGAGKGEIMSIDKFNKIGYNDYDTSVKQTLLDETKKLYDKGEITDAQYKALIK